MACISSLLPHRRHHHHHLSHPSLITALVFTLCLFVFHSPEVSSSNDHQSPAKMVEEGVLLVEEKTRLGSTPPSCHNKCTSCHPCMAVQVPTMPSHNRVEPGSSSSSSSSSSSEESELYDTYYDPPAAGNRYSNYKPLGWKCRCGDHFYNP